MIRLVLTVALFVSGLVVQAQQLTKIKAGDTLTVVTANQIQYSGDFIVSSDGTITIQVFGQFHVAGKDVVQVTKEVQSKAREYVRNAQVTVILKQELQQFVYLVSENDLNGETAWTPGINVRQLISRHPTLGPLDSYVAKLYSAGQPPKTIDVVKLMRKEDESQNLVLNPGDVLTLLPAASKPVWVVGAVNKPGLVRLRDKDGASQAIALANGVVSSQFSSSQVTVTLRRGADSWTKPIGELDSPDQWQLEPGDTLSIQLPKLIKVTVGGFVKRSGEVTVRDNAPLLSAVESAGGANEAGTLQRVLVFRKGQVLVEDARSVGMGGEDGGQGVEDGDFIYVSENKRTYQVFGFVNRPGTKVMADSHKVTLSDALSESEGLNPKGTYRNTIVLRAGADGKFIPAKYDFDRYIKDGDASQNPELLPGDIVFFNQVSGTSIQDLLRILPSLLLLERLF